MISRFSPLAANKQITALIYVLSFFFCLTLRAQFTAGNLVVLQAGDGSIPLANTGNAILLKEFTPLGAPAFSVAISSTLSPLILSGSATSEGALSLSPNGKYLVFGGYAVNFPYVSSLSAATAASVNRGIGILDAAGNYSRVATSTSFFSGTNIRSAASDGLNNYWSGGGTNGTNYFGTASPSVTIQNSNTNTRNVLANNSGLYFSTGSGTQGIYKVGTGLPVTLGQATSLIINTSTSGNGSASCFAFYFNANQTLCYVADDRSFVNGGGVQKWVYSNNTWSLSYVLATGGTSGARGVVADFSMANPMVYATTDEGSSNRLVAINDAGAASTATTLATATQNTLFRGLAFSPYCLAPQINSISSGTVCAEQSFTLNPSLAGTAPLSYSWTGPGSFSSSAQNPATVAAASGTYSLFVSNGCGNAAAVHSVVVNPLPDLSVNEPVICFGGMVTLMANGANSYTWNTSDNTNTISVSPLVTTNYTVSGTSLQGCTNTQSTSVAVTNSLMLSANSVTICDGMTATLTVYGATNYTWSTLAFTPGMTVTPLGTTVYTVIGAAPGCTSIAVTTASVFINPLPALTMSGSAICGSGTATLTAYGAVSYSWSNQTSGSSIFVSPTVNTIYTVTGTSAEGCLASIAYIVFVYPKPTATLTIPNYTVCMNGSPQTFTGMPQGGLFSGSAMNADQFNPVVASAGTFAIVYTYTDTNNCAGSDSQTITVIPCATISVNELSVRDRVSIFPIPASEEVQIHYTHFSTPLTLEVRDLTGALRGKLILNKESIAINIHEYLPGIYFIKIDDGKQSHYLKFIKQ